MSRTKGAKDRHKRIMNPRSLETVRRATPGYSGAQVWIYAPDGVLRRFLRLSKEEKAKVIEVGVNTL